MKISMAALCVLFSVTFSIHSQEILKSAAVLKFENRSSLPENDWLGLGFSETITTKLGLVEGLYVVERTKLHDLLLAGGKEDDLNETKEPDGDQYRQILGVDYLLIGSVQSLGSYKNENTTLKINARVIKTASAKVSGELSFSVSGSVKELFNLQTELAAKFCEVLGVTAGLADLSFEDAQSLLAQQLYGEGLKAYYAGGYDQAIGLFRDAVNKNEGVFYAAAHTMEGYARQKQIAKATQQDKDRLKQSYVEQFRKDASEAAPAFYDLGLAHQAVGDHSESIKNFRSFLAYLGQSDQFVIKNPFTDDDSPKADETASSPYSFETNKGLRVTTEDGNAILQYSDPEINSDAKFLLRRDTLFVMSNSVFAFSLKPAKLLWKCRQEMSFDFKMVLEKGRLYIIGFDQVTILDAATGIRMAYWSMPVLSDLNYFRIANGVFWSGYDSVAYNLNVLLSARKAQSETDALFQIGKSYELAQKPDSALYYYDIVLGSRREYIDALDSRSEVLYRAGKIPEAVSGAMQAISYGAPCRSRELLYEMTGVSGFTVIPGWMSHVEVQDSNAYLGVSTPGFVGKPFSKIYNVNLARMETLWSFDLLAGSYMPSFSMNSKALFTYKPVENSYTLLALSRSTGRPIWQKDLAVPYLSSEYYDEFVRPAATEKTVLSTLGPIYGFDAVSGKTLWKIDQAGGGFDEYPDGWTMPEGMDEERFGQSYIGGTPLALNNRFYASTPHNLICLSEDGKILWKNASDHHKLSLRAENGMVSVQDFGESDLAKRFFDPATGRRLCSVRDRGFHRVHKDETHSIFDGKFIYTLEENIEGIIVRKSGPGLNISSKPFRLNNFSSDLGMRPVMADGELWVLLGYLNQDGTNYGGVAVFDATTLRMKWKLDLGKNVVHMSSSGDSYFIFCSRGDIIRMDKKKVSEILARGKNWWVE